MANLTPKKQQNQHRVFTGIVVSGPRHKTAAVRVDRMKMHPKYRKQYRVSRTYHVHDEQNQTKVGDTVTFVECRPLSKTKRWRLVQSSPARTP